MPLARFVPRPTWAALLLVPMLAGEPARAEGGGIFERVPLGKRDAEMIRMANELEELLRRRGAVLPDGPETQLVQRVGAAVAPAHPADSYQRFRFGVIDSAVPNAFALPDGQVYVHSGLLAILENEAQLAGVLAHECTHVEGHHSIVHGRRARREAGAMIALSVVLGQYASLVNIAFQAAILGYGRDLESESDRRAVPRLLEAGYDPREIPRIFELLDRDPEGDRPEPSAFWSSHPAGRQRRIDTSAQLDAMADAIDEADRAGGLRIGEEGYLGQVQAVSKQTVTQLIAADRPRTALDIAQRLREAAPEDPDAAALVGDCLVALDARTPEPEPDELTKRAKRAKRAQYSTRASYERARARLSAADAADTLTANRALAEAAYEQALSLEPEHLGALAGLGTLEEKRGRDVEAGRWYARFLRAAAADHPRHAAIVIRLRQITERLKADAPAAAPRPPAPAPAPAPVPGAPAPAPPPGASRARA